jgi:glycosyltransferase involved in cell wall biosynthesis
LPTGVDTDRSRPAPLPQRPVIGWIGTGGNLHYLQSIAPALAQVLRAFPETEIAVCSDRRPKLDGLPVRFVPWSEASEPWFLSAISIGVMPLADGPWERGKCSFKMLQYMAAARPCVVSPVGMNNEILRQAEIGRAAATTEEWAEALCGLLADRGEAERLGAAGRQLAVDRYSVAALAPELARLLRRVA